MTYRELANVFLMGLFRAGLAVELLIVKFSRDLFQLAVVGLDRLWVSGKRQMEAIPR